MPNDSIDIGIPEDQREAISEGLRRLLADNATLYFMTHGFHWNVTGPMFQTLHLMFEAQYNEMWLATDLIAERIRSLGSWAPTSWAAIHDVASVPEAREVPRAQTMIRMLVDGHETVIRTARELLPIVEEARDEVTADLLTQRLQVHEKTAWMLRSLLAE